MVAARNGGAGMDCRVTERRAEERTDAERQDWNILDGYGVL